MIRYLVLFLALVFSTSAVVADSRSEAKARYQAGVKAYNSGDYKTAIREFSAAQEIMPADLNNYNLALCYDKLGDPEPAIQYYRAFLDKQPSSDKKAEIEASIRRLDAAAKSAAAKRDAAAKEEEARKAAEARRAEEDARKAEEAARRDEEARRAEDTRRTPDVRAPDPDVVGPGIGSTGTPGGSGTVSTGDSHLDRVARIDVNAIRDQRVGGQSSGMIAPQPAGPAGAPNTAGDPNNAAANIDVGAHASGGTAATASNATAPTPAGQQPQGTPDPADKPKGKPVYKKWWFWAVVAVSAYVVYSIATEDSRDDNMSRVLPPMANSPAVGNGGMTLMRW